MFQDQILVISIESWIGLLGWLPFTKSQICRLSLTIFFYTQPRVRSLKDSLSTKMCAKNTKLPRKVGLGASLNLCERASKWLLPDSSMSFCSCKGWVMLG